MESEDSASGCLYHNGFGIQPLGVMMVKFQVFDEHHRYCTKTETTSAFHRGQPLCA
jgi:hypothetical protein